jgi:hypothetical protein
MTRLETPLLGTTVWKTGDILLRAELVSCSRTARAAGRRRLPVAMSTHP